MLNYSFGMGTSSSVKVYLLSMSDLVSLSVIVMRPLEPFLIPSCGPQLVYLILLDCAYKTTLALQSELQSVLTAHISILLSLKC